MKKQELQHVKKLLTLVNTRFYGFPDKTGQNRIFYSKFALNRF